MSCVFLNGRICDEASASISVNDRGLLLGDGIFETLRAYGGKLFRLGAHLSRLRASAQFLNIPFTFSDEAIEGAISELVRRNECAEAYVRVTVTRGTGARGLRMDDDCTPTVLIQVRAFAPYADKVYCRGVRVMVSTVRQNSASPVARHKTLNYLPYLLARREATEAGAHGAILLNEHGQVAEESVSNVFLAQGERLVTPPLHAGILPGVTRGVVMALAKGDGIEVAERPVAAGELFEASEMFLTNSLREVVPVRSVDKQSLKGGAPGAMTARLQGLYRETVRAETGRH